MIMSVVLLLMSQLDIIPYKANLTIIYLFTKPSTKNIIKRIKDNFATTSNPITMLSLGLSHSVPPPVHVLHVPFKHTLLYQIPHVLFVALNLESHVDFVLTSGYTSFADLITVPTINPIIAINITNDIIMFYIKSIICFVRSKGNFFGCFFPIEKDIFILGC